MRPILLLFAIPCYLESYTRIPGATSGCRGLAEDCLSDVALIGNPQLNSAPLHHPSKARMSLSQIAIKTLCADRGKLLTAIVGVAFSIALVNIQTGLFIGLMRKAGLLVDHSRRISGSAIS